MENQTLPDNHSAQDGTSTHPSDLDPRKNANIPLIIYILYLASFVLGITFLIGVVMAYIYRADADGWQRDHYRFLIRTFWISVLYSIIGALLCIIAIGYVVILLTMLWLVIRCVRGIKAFAEKRAPQKLTSWLY